MLRNTLYDNYEIDFSDDYSKYEKAYAFIIDQNRNFYLNSEDDIEIVDVKELEEVCDVNFILYIGQYKDEPCLVANINSKTEKCGVFSVNEAYNKKRVNDYFTPLINIYDLNEDLYYVASRAALINDWYIRNQYCGGCGCNEGGCNSILWIIILLSCCCGNNGGFCGNNGCGGGNDCLWIILLLLCCGGCGNGNGFC